MERRGAGACPLPIAFEARSITLSSAGMRPYLLLAALWANVVGFITPWPLIYTENKIMPKKAEQPASFETALKELEHIVSRLESGELPLEEALNEFEHGVRLARQGQQTLQQAEQRV